MSFFSDKVTRLWRFSISYLPKGVSSIVHNSMKSIEGLFWSSDKTTKKDFSIRLGAMRASGFQIDPREFIDILTGRSFRTDILLGRIMEGIAVPMQFQREGKGAQIALTLPTQIKTSTTIEEQLSGLEDTIEEEHQKLIKLEESSHSKKLSKSQSLNELWAYRRLLLQRDMTSTKPNYPRVLLYFKTNGIIRSTILNMRAARNVLDERFSN